MKQSQKLLLTWLIEDTRLFGAIKGLITVEDFTEEFLELDGIHQYNDRRSSPQGKE